MAIKTKAPDSLGVKAPDWLDKDPKEWPAAAKTVFELLAVAAERRLASDAQSLKYTVG